MTGKYLFPSPSGVSHFSIRRSLTSLSLKISVSVPFRGISFLNVDTVPYPRKPDTGFRPLPGYLISQYYNSEIEGDVSNGFRPLPGYLISQFNIGSGCVGITNRFPSPSGVSHFSICNSCGFQIFSDCFRPLPGYLISQ